MRFHADLHIHSKYSRATSRDLDLEHLAAWSARKGISVVATGDYTHPAWRAELKEKLVPAEGGVFRLRPEIEREVARGLPPACQTLPRFMLEVEISTIYKKGERTRKVHHLIYAPDFDTADRFSASLARIGNITSDGRPILGLDSRHLLEIALESGPDAYLIPAHIWTPWFAALGSQSGFESIRECYGDLTDHIFAVETGLSSDPAMNWRLSQLDRYRLVSNSDAHSPGKLGREATMFDCEPDYYAIRRALETGDGYVGTVEFFPEEGKYHLDGHRKCGVRQTPTETLANGGRCSVCGQMTTVGVLHRVEVLADRSEAEARPPATAGEVASLVPLPEVIGEIAASGPGSRTVERNYDRLVSTLGAELSILSAVPLEDIARQASPLLAEAIGRLRAGQVIREAGYDGEYGVIRLFEETELRRLTAGESLFEPSSSAASASASASTPLPSARRVKAAGSTREHLVDAPSPVPELRCMDLLTVEQDEAQAVVGDASTSASPSASTSESTPPSVVASVRPDLLDGLDDDQRAAASTVDGPLLIVAGPGSGKTRTLTHRIAHLIAERGVAASSCLAITFTRRAAAEMRERLAALLPVHADRVPIHTFHSLGLAILREHADAAGLRRDFRVADQKEQLALLVDALGLSGQRAATLLRAMSKRKRTQSNSGCDEELTQALAAYRRALTARNAIDFDDLVGLTVQALEHVPAVAASCRERFRWISVDEFQDVDEQQYRLLTLLAPAGGNLCAIGDPNQAIYGFRGADASCFDRFAEDYAGAAVVCLTRNYRSTGTIVTASSQVIAPAGQDRPIADLVRDMHERITIHAAPTDRAEAEFVVRTIDALMGGHSFFSLDSGRVGGVGGGPAPAASAALGFGDFAVLYRTDAQSAALCDAFAQSGIPFARHAHDPIAEQPAVCALLDTLRTTSADDRSRAERSREARSHHRGRAEHPQSPRLFGEPASFSTESRAGSREEDVQRLAARLRRAAELLATRSGAPRDGCPPDDGAAGAPEVALDVAARELALERLLMLAEASEGDEARFADAVALAAEADFRDPRADCVSLLTIHAAKGLEFPVVFLVGLEDGVLPLYFHPSAHSPRAGGPGWSELDAATAAEERRLFYVGMTRAKDRLFLTRAQQRMWRGRVRSLEPSPFLGDIESELVKHQRAQLPRARPEDRQLRLL